jgi:hypothetical protein
MKMRHFLSALTILLLAGCNLSAATPTPHILPTAPPTDIPQELFPTALTTPVNPDCPATPNNWVPYTIQAGDSLGALAQETSSSINDLVAANCLSNPDQITEGTTIYLPQNPQLSP